MRLPRPHLTVRRLMVAVAVVATISGGVVWVRRRAEFARDRAAHHRALFFEVMNDPEACMNFAAYKKYADYHLEWEMKWERESHRPWLPFEAETPPPQ